MRLPWWLRVAFPPYVLAAGSPGKALASFSEASARVAAHAEAVRLAGPEAAGGSPDDVIRAAARNALATVPGAGLPATVQAEGGQPVPVTSQSVGLAGSVFAEGGWLADGPERDVEPEPDTGPLRKTEPLPDGVLGYGVVLRGESRDTLADSDLRRTLQVAEADAAVHGKRPGWAGRTAACEVRLAGTEEGAEAGGA